MAKQVSGIPPQIPQALARRLNHRYLRVLSGIIIATYLLALAASFAVNNRGRTIFGPLPGADFAVFYVAGSMYDRFPPERIYDSSIHTRTYHDLFPDAEPGDQLPYGNAPFFVLPFALLALLPYRVAYALWLAFSVGLYCGGLALLRGRCASLGREEWRTASLLALSFTPFLVEGLSGGQVAVVGFFFVSLALYLERQGREWAAGAALAVCLYKPTLLVLILPMLVVTRRGKMLGGFAAGTLGLTAVSLLAAGVEGCRAYIETLFMFLGASTAPVSGLRTWKYVDINSFARLLTGGNAYLRWGIVLTVAGTALPLLYTAWRRASSAHERGRNLAWAGALALTPVLNVYAGIYDTILVVPAALLAAEAFCCSDANGTLAFPARYTWLLVLLYLVPWFTQPIARFTGVQLYTVLLAASGVYLTQRTNGHETCDGNSNQTGSMGSWTCS